MTFWFAAKDGGTFGDGDRSLQWRIDGSAVGEHDFLLCVNMEHAAATFRLPPPHADTRWVRLIDTAQWAEPAGNCWPIETAGVMDGATYDVHPYTVAVFRERAAS